MAAGSAVCLGKTRAVSGSTGQLDLSVAQRQAAQQSSRRLWSALSRPVRRTLPPKGIDAVAARLRGVAARRRASRRERVRAVRIVARATELASLSESGLDALIAQTRERVMLCRDEPATIDEAFAVAHEAVRREIGLTLYVEQVMGALAIASGCCAEMATGEGKTLTAILPAALDGWLGRGVHVLTVNDYLARRDAKTTAPAYGRLGLSVGVLQNETKPDDRTRAYACSITYAADKQVIFDFLRDRLHGPVQPRLATVVLDQALAEVADGINNADWTQRVVQRGLCAAIIDEADSVLIDEAVTPAIIGMPTPIDTPEDPADHYRIAATMAEHFEIDRDYIVDTRMRRVRLTGAGRARRDAMAGQLPAFWRGPRRSEELIVQAIGARELYVLGDDYIIRDDKVVIVDRSTGRVLDGRQWQLGVHQSVEAKEGVELSDDRKTSARISYQKFFQRYHRLGGMTGTCWEVAGELWRDYGLPVVRIPTHRPIIRQQIRDRFFETEESREKAVANRVMELHATGRPVLVGTRSVTSSERLGALLDGHGVPVRILNATREAQEADIVARAGQPGAVTVATNMAGRGTDILLTDRTRQLGGLVVIATERNDERRVDRQLFGRAGRQGDPGRAETYVSFEDQLVVRNGQGLVLWLARRLPGFAGTALARLAWWLAQRTASKRGALARSQVAQADAWIDVAMHHETR